MSLKIRFVTDYVCPYCLVAKIPLMEAVKGKDIVVEWLPYELVREPAPRIDTYHDETRKKKWAIGLAPIAKAQGIDMKLPPKVIPRPYTRLAFEGLHFARENGCGEAYNDRMYTAYFVDELDIGDLEVLCGLAAEVGLDEKEFRRALEEGVYTQKQKEAVDYAENELKIQSVPTIFIGETRIEGGVYTKEEFEKIIEEAMKADETQVLKGMSCGIHGCN